MQPPKSRPTQRSVRRACLGAGAGVTAYAAGAAAYVAARVPDLAARGYGAEAVGILCVAVLGGLGALLLTLRYAAATAHVTEGADDEDAAPVASP